MELQLVRNATLRLTYAGKTLLIDPCLGAKGSLPSFAGIEANPTVTLPIPAEDVLDGVDITLISHLHADHFDPAAERLLPRQIPILCQPANHAELLQKGFTNAQALVSATTIGPLIFTPTPGQHGTGDILKKMGSVIGFTLTALNEPSIYWAGDTVLTQQVLDVIDRVQPDVIITHSGGATLSNTLLLLDDTQTIDLARHAKGSTIIAVHLEALDHCTVTRNQLRAAAEQSGISSERLLIPRDGDVIVLPNNL